MAATELRKKWSRRKQLISTGEDPYIRPVLVMDDELLIKYVENGVTSHGIKKNWIEVLHYCDEYPEDGVFCNHIYPSCFRCEYKLPDKVLTLLKIVNCM